MNLIPAGCKTFLFDSQKLADEDSNKALADIQKSLFGQIEANLHEIELKL